MSNITKEQALAATYYISAYHYDAFLINYFLEKPLERLNNFPRPNQVLVKAKELQDFFAVIEGDKISFGGPILDADGQQLQAEELQEIANLISKAISK